MNIRKYINCTIISLVLMIFAGCNGMSDIASWISESTPSSSHGNFSYTTNLIICLTSLSNGIKITWHDADTFYDKNERYWVARTKDYYLNDYIVISDGFWTNISEFIDTNTVQGNTYFYRILSYYSYIQTISDGNGQYHTETVEVCNMSRAASIEF